jgi:hypothetical protein
MWLRDMHGTKIWASLAGGGCAWLHTVCPTHAAKLSVLSIIDVAVGLGPRNLRHRPLLYYAIQSLSIHINIDTYTCMSNHFYKYINAH